MKRKKRVLVLGDDNAVIAALLAEHGIDARLPDSRTLVPNQEEEPPSITKQTSSHGPPQKGEKKRKQRINSHH